MCAGVIDHPWGQLPSCASCPLEGASYRAFQAPHKVELKRWSGLGKASREKSCLLLDIVQKWPPPPPPALDKLGVTFGSRFRKKLQLKTTSKQPKKNPQNYLKTTPKLPLNFWNRSNPPPSLLCNVQQKAKKKLPQNF